MWLTLGSHSIASGLEAMILETACAAPPRMRNAFSCPKLSIIRRVLSFAPIEGSTYHSSHTWRKHVSEWVRRNGLIFKDHVLWGFDFFSPSETWAHSPAAYDERIPSLLKNNDNLGQITFINALVLPFAALFVPSFRPLPTSVFRHNASTTISQEQSERSNRWQGRCFFEIKQLDH